MSIAASTATAFKFHTQRTHLTLSTLSLPRAVGLHLPARPAFALPLKHHHSLQLGGCDGIGEDVGTRYPTDRHGTAKPACDLGPQLILHHHFLQHLSLTVRETILIIISLFTFITSSCFQPSFASHFPRIVPYNPSPPYRAIPPRQQQGLTPQILQVVHQANSIDLVRPLATAFYNCSTQNHE